MVFEHDREPHKPDRLAVGAAPVRLMVLGSGLFSCGVALQVSGLSREWMQWVHDGEAWLHESWAAVTLLGFGWPLLIFGVVHAQRRTDAMAALVKAALLAMLATQVPKLLWPHPRPAMVLEPGQLSLVGEAVVHSGSMPSGHALAAFAVLGAAWLSRPGQGRPLGGWVWAWGGALALALLVAWSRVAVGAHWPADVLVGAGAGLVVAWLAWRWEQHRPWRSWFDRRLGHWTLVGFLVLAAVAWYFTRTGYPSANGLQLATALLALIEAVRRAWWCQPGRSRAAAAPLSGMSL